jgi:putative tryptophan/tyrosine transport system substrate-binding protein
MRRRELIGLLGGTLAMWPLVASAQQSAVPVIGYLSPASPIGAGQTAFNAIRRGMRDTGFVEGQNVTVEYRWAEGQLDRLPALAADLVRRHVSVIATSGGLTSARAARAATSTIPIVFLTASDPVQLGVVASLNRPGGNITGVTIISTEISSKQLAVLLELAPEAKTVAQIINAATLATNVFAQNEVATAARALGRQHFVVGVRSPLDLEAAFATLAQRKADALFVSADPLFNDNRRPLIEFAAGHGIPTSYYEGDFVREGGLISYGASLEAAYRQVGSYVGQILRGANPADLPVLRPSRFELVINLKTAKALSLVVPPTLLASAHEVIE